MNNHKCPYTLRSVGTIIKSREHIIPEALGGPRALSLVADRGRNSAFGSSVDLKLSRHPWVLMLAIGAKVTTKSGPVKFHLDCFDEAKQGVQIEFSAEGVRMRYRQPVVKDEKGDMVGVRGFTSAEVQGELARVTQQMGSKGRAIIPLESRLISGSATGPILFELAPILQGLGKIAYLMAHRTFGDEFLATTAASEFRSLVEMKDPTFEEICQQRLEIHHAVGDAYENLFRDLSGNNHVLYCEYNGDSVISVVRLFDSNILSFAFVSTACDGLTTQKIRNTIYIDAKAGKIIPSPAVII